MDKVVKNREYMCPQCGDDMDLQTEDWYFDDNTAIFEMYCPKCGKQWREYFLLKYDGYGCDHRVYNEYGEDCGV